MRNMTDTDFRQTHLMRFKLVTIVYFAQKALRVTGHHRSKWGVLGRVYLGIFRTHIYPNTTYIRKSEKIPHISLINPHISSQKKSRLRRDFQPHISVSSFSTIYPPPCICASEATRLWQIICPKMIVLKHVQKWS